MALLHPTEPEVLEVLLQLEAPTDRMILVVGSHTLPLTNLDKTLWSYAAGGPGTKRDLLRYLTRVAPYFLPHVDGRPVFVARFPDGAAGQSFYQKAWDNPPPFVKTLSIWSSDHGIPRDYLLVGNLPTLLWLGQQASLEFHVWFSRIASRPDGRRLGVRYGESLEALEASRLNYPDFLVVDLDSYDYSGHEAAGSEPELHRRGFGRVREVAFEVRRVAEALGLHAFVKTSGRTGLHVYLPIVRRFTFDDVRGMAETIGNFLMAIRPREVTLQWAVRDRSGKVLFDYNRNVRGKSLAAPFSPRRHPLATVSMPVTWDELAHVYPTDFTLRTVPDLLDERGDPWRDILHAKADIATVLAAPAEAG